MSEIQIIGTILGVLTTWSAVLLWAVKWLLNNIAEHYVESFQAEITRLDNNSKKREERITKNTELINEKAERLKTRIETLEKGQIIQDKEIGEKYQKREDTLREMTLIDAHLEHIKESQNKLWLRVEQIYTSLSNTGCVPLPSEHHE